MNGEPIEEKIIDSRVTIDGDDLQGLYSLKVTGAQKEDSGEYTVTAVNEHGKIFHAVSVTVAPKTLPKKRYFIHIFPVGLYSRNIHYTARNLTVLKFPYRLVFIVFFPFKFKM